LRFSRKIDAEAFIEFAGIPIENNLKVTSHSWTMELVREEGTKNA
jgi:hypothetical protein